MADASSAAPLTERRAYDSTLRRQRSAETRERIVAAACELLQDSSIRDWQTLTVRSVAERAGVNERTVYRHLGTERGLRDAAMRRLEEQAGIDLAGLKLEDVARVTARIFEEVSTHPIAPRPPLDPTLNAAGQRTRDALLRAVSESTPAWSQHDQLLAAAMLDVLWSVASYERLVADWELDPDLAIEGITWMVHLIEEAVSAGRGPSAS